MRLLFASLLFFVGSVIVAQTTWAEHTAEVFYNNCTSCHHDNGIAPFSLMNYPMAEVMGPQIVDAVLTGYMPPWTADTTYQEYSHERVLNATEKQAIFDWAADGFIQGDVADAPPPPVYNDLGFISAPADLELIMDPYMSNATDIYDDYVCISIPSGLAEDKRIRAFEVIPGNSAIVHHCLVYIDEGGTYESNLTGFCGGPTEGLIGGYTPGTGPTVFPSNGTTVNMGVTIPAGANIVFAMHYPAGSAGETDETRIRFHFYDDDTFIRPVFSSPIIQDWDFFIPANEEVEVEAEFDFVPVDMSVLTVFPHMHLIGERIESWAITPENDTIPFVKIPHWDFDWQEFLLFKNIQHVPANSTLYGKALYRNTADHPHNPNDPPEDMSAGLNTTDEMFLVYFHYTPYFAGDELLDLEEYTALPTHVLTLEDATGSVSVTPNPSNGPFTLTIELDKAQKASLYIYDQSGKMVEKVVQGQVLNTGTNTLMWDGSKHAAGTYFYSLNMGGTYSNGKLLLR